MTKLLVEICDVFLDKAGDAITEIHLCVVGHSFDGQSLEVGWCELGLLSLNLLHNAVVASICLPVLSQSVDLVFDGLHLL